MTSLVLDILNADPDRLKVEEQQQQQQQALSDDSNAESAFNSGLKQNLTNEDDLKSTYMVNANVRVLICSSILYLGLALLDSLFFRIIQ